MTTSFPFRLSRETSKLEETHTSSPERRPSVTSSLPINGESCSQTFSTSGSCSPARAKIRTHSHAHAHTHSFTEKPARPEPFPLEVVHRLLPVSHAISAMLLSFEASFGRFNEMCNVLSTHCMQCSREFHRDLERSMQHREFCEIRNVKSRQLLYVGGIAAFTPATGMVFSSIVGWLKSAKLA